MGNFVAFIDELGGRIAVVAGFVAAVVADRGADQRRDHDFVGLHRLFNRLRQLRQHGRLNRLLDLTGLQQLLIGLLDRGTQAHRRSPARSHRTFLSASDLERADPSPFMPSLAPAWPNFMPFGKLSWQNPETTADQLDAPLLRAVPLGRPLFEIAAHFADDDDRLRLRIVLEHFEIADIVGSGIGIAADADRRRDAVGKLRADPDNLVGETAGLGDDAERTFAIELGEDQVVECAADHAQAGRRRLRQCRSRKGR